MWNDFLLHIFSKHLIKSRVNSVELARCLGSVLLPSTYFRTLWSDGLRSLLLLVVCRMFGLIVELFVPVRTIWHAPEPSDVCRTGDRSWVFDHACPSMPPVFLLSGAFRVTTLCDIFGVRGSPMIIFLPLPLSAAHGRTKIFLLVGSNVLTGTSGISIFIS
jgi:hypothetical protein